MNKIIWLSILILITSCAIKQPTSIRADFYVSDITKDSIACSKQYCQILIGETEILFLSDERELLINSFSWVSFSNVVGLDQNKKSWEVIVGNTIKEPYLMLLKSDSLAVLIGFKCYTQ